MRNKLSLFFLTLFTAFCVLSCQKTDGESVVLNINGNVEMSGDNTDIITVVPGQYTLKKTADNGVPTILVKLNLKRTNTKAENFKATRTSWSIYLIGEDGQQLSGGELKLQKGPSDETEAERFTKWVCEAGEGDTDTFLFTIVADNEEQASSLIQNSKSIMLKTGHKQTAAAKTEKANPDAELRAQGFSFASILSGYVGGFWGTLDISCGSGYIDLGNGGERTLKVKSVEGNKVVISAYLNGKYIGYYSGTVSYSHGERYKGIFYNTVNGGKVNFDLSN